MATPPQGPKEVDDLVAQLQALAKSEDDHYAAIMGRVLTFDFPPHEIAEQLSREVVGQDQAVQRCAVILRQHMLRVRHHCLRNTDAQMLPRHTVLLIGPTGTGKSLLARALAGLSGLPFHSEDLTTVSETGYVGRDCSDILQSMVRKAGGLLPAGCSIIFLDELDKLAASAGRTRDISGEGAQELLLRIIEGGPLEAMPGKWMRGMPRSSESLNTDNVLVIAAGAFVGLDAIVKRRLRGRRVFGFSTQARLSSPDKMASQSCALTVTTDDLIGFGLKPELVGRFTDIISLSALGREELLGILGLPQGPLEACQRLASLEGFSIEFTEELLDAIADEAVDSGMGARNLQAIVSRLTYRAFYEMPGHRRKLGIERPVAVFDKQALADGSYRVVEVAEQASVGRKTQTPRAGKGTGEAESDT
jgi:ATP-dependent Clp protease ATP-binding subunit ClpX